MEHFFHSVLFCTAWTMTPGAPGTIRCRTLMFARAAKLGRNRPAERDAARQERRCLDVKDLPRV
jgi:hypothetical protein